MNIYSINMLRDYRLKKNYITKSKLYVYLLYIYISKQRTMDRQINGQLMIIGLLNLTIHRQLEWPL